MPTARCHRTEIVADAVTILPGHALRFALVTGYVRFSPAISSVRSVNGFGMQFVVDPAHSRSTGCITGHPVNPSVVGALASHIASFTCEKSSPSTCPNARTSSYCSSPSIAVELAQSPLITIRACVILPAVEKPSTTTRTPFCTQSAVLDAFVP